MKHIISRIKTTHLLILGLLVLCCSFLPTFLLGTDSIVPYHDQLDGEIISYIYRAKYLCSGENTLPEFLNGAPKTTLVPPAPLAVLFFRVLPPFGAYTFLQMFVQTFAYMGTFLLIHRITGNKYISLITALLYTFIPFLPVYGLSQYGVPMLLLCFHNLYKHRHTLPSYLYIALYTGMSSLVLCGFSWIIIGFILALHFLFRKNIRRQLPLLFSFLWMLVLYIAENISLILQLFGLGDAFVSHKAEYTLTSSSFLSQFFTHFKEIGAHAPDYHNWIIPLVLGTLLFSLPGYRKRSTQIRSLTKWLLADIGVIAGLCAGAALWTTPLAVSIRENTGALKSFQFTRLLWLTPALWYIAFGLCLSILWSARTFYKWFTYAFSFVIISILSFHCLKGSFLKPCLQELLLPEYETISWSDYFALGVMEQVEEHIHTTDGKRLNEYKVASLGIDPSAALYHGFYCVDGYSNNYPLEYKHRFRQVIAPELELSPWLTSYYDDWGNRCYLFSSEIPGYFNIEKGSFWFNHLQLNTASLKDLGCDYILSAAYIVNAEELNLTLLREEPFETESSYYRIYLYKLMES